MKKPIFTNVVEESVMREVQSETLKILREILKKSFGPYGSNTTITKAAGSTVTVNYTKDGHKILQSVIFQDVIETAVKENIEDLTRDIVLKVGDGTTSAVILSSLIFDALVKESENYSITPYEVIRNFKEAVELIKDIILSYKQEFTPQAAYDIALISTNGNVGIAENIKKIYEDHGSEVYIDVSTSPTQDNILKIYDGMTIDVGYSESAYVNTNSGKSSLKSPQIYMFDDPIDTPEMGGLLDAIIENNIIRPYNTKNLKEVKPTVIFAPRISRDFSTYMELLANMMYSIENPINRPPLLIVANVADKDRYSDMAHLCGCKTIKKYINPELYKKDVEAGLAPTKDTILSFFGTADLVEADATKTKIISPKHLYKPGTTEYSETFKNLINFLETELKTVTETTTDSTQRYKLKKRIQSLKSNLVEYLIGGVSMSDRDSLRDLVEDAVKNCRSAAQTGVGYAANFEGLRASHTLLDIILTTKDEKIKNAEHIVKIINRAYRQTITELYRVSGIQEHNIESLIDQSVYLNGKPYDLKEKQFSDKVLTSINSDICILDTISKVITLMITTNQFLCPDVIYNKYVIVK